MPGETLTYDVTWTAFSAGEITASLQKLGQGPADDYEITTKAHSRGFVSLLYNLNDEFHSQFDPQTLCSRQISKTTNEGRRHKSTQIVFDGARGVAVLSEHNLSEPASPPKHDENPIPACVHDVVTAFYFLRTQPLRVGQTVQLPVNDGSKTTLVTVEVQAREEIQTPLGKRDAFRVEPTVFGSLYKRKGRMLIWFSDDSERLPLRIKAMISVGTITATLRSASQAPATTPSDAVP